MLEGNAVIPMLPDPVPVFPSVLMRKQMTVAIPAAPRKRIMNDIIREALQSSAPKRRAKGDNSAASNNSTEIGIEDLLSLAPAEVAASHIEPSAGQTESSQLVFDEDGNIVLADEVPTQHTASGFSGSVLEASVVSGYADAYKKTKATRWTESETDRFYDALSKFGSDLALVNSAFPSMSAVQIRQKYKMEDRKNPKKVEAALKNRKRSSSSFVVPLTALPAISFDSNVSTPEVQSDNEPISPDFDILSELLLS